MKKALIGSMVALLSFGSVVYADSYFPPERIECSVSVNGQLKCNEFQHQYLTEEAYIPNLNPGMEEVFYFVSGVAYVSSHKEFGIFYTYKNDKMKTIRLKTVNTSIQPDFKETGWRKLADGIFTCQAGYRQCPITNLPPIANN